MANPVLKPLPEGQVVPVGLNVKGGWVRIKKGGCLYLQTYKMPGETAPTVEEMEEYGDCVYWEIVQQKKRYVIRGIAYVGIDDNTSVDIYMMALDGDGLVRMDL